MKKLYAFAAAVLATLSLNAQSLYFMGDGEGLSWSDFPGKEVTKGADGNYTVAINNLNAFKMSTAVAANWDEFNAAAVGFNGTYGDAVGTAAGQTVELAAYGENQQMPWVGNYTLVINGDLTSMTVKTFTPKPEGFKHVYLRGSMNDWGTSDEFTTADGKTYVYQLASITTNDEFKVADANWGTINFGYSSPIAADTEVTLVSGGGNMKVAEDLTDVTLIFNLDTRSFLVSTKDVPGTYPATLYLIGDVNGETWNTNTTLSATGNNGVYVWSNVTVNDANEGKGYFSFITFPAASWDGDEKTPGVNSYDRYGAATSNTPLALNGSDSIVLYAAGVDASASKAWEVAAGKYDITANLATMTVSLSTPGLSGVEVVEAAEGEAVYFNLQGQKIANPEKGIYIKVQNGKAVKVVK